MRMVKIPYIRNRRLILGNRRKPHLKSGRLKLGNGKTQKGGFLSAVAALAPVGAQLFGKLYGGGKKRPVVKRVVNKRQNKIYESNKHKNCTKCISIQIQKTFTFTLSQLANLINVSSGFQLEDLISGMNF